MPRAVRRLLAALVLALPPLLLAATPASATICYIDASGEFGLPDPPPVYYPCPGPGDQPAPAPVWVTTDAGPGYDSPEWSFIRVQRGGRIFFANVSPTEQPDGFLGTERFWYPGLFDSGLVPYGSYAEVQGISQLPIGAYAILDANDGKRGTLYVDPPPCPPGADC